MRGAESAKLLGSHWPASFGGCRDPWPANSSPWEARVRLGALQNRGPSDSQASIHRLRVHLSFVTDLSSSHVSLNPRLLDVGRYVCAASQAWHFALMPFPGSSTFGSASYCEALHVCAAAPPYPGLPEAMAISAHSSTSMSQQLGRPVSDAVWSPLLAAAVQAWVVRIANEGEVVNTKLVMKEVVVSSKRGGDAVVLKASLPGAYRPAMSTQPV